MKSVLISKPPKQVANILNGKQTIIISKTTPKDWMDYLSGKTKEKPKPRTAYIYCTKTIKPLSDYDWGEFKFDDLPKLGKVCAKFMLREVKSIHDRPEGTCDSNPNVPHPNWHHFYQMGIVSEKLLYGGDENTFSEEYGELLRRQSCLSQQQIFDYLNKDKNVIYGAKGYAWFISDLVIFDEPKEISEFKEDFQSWVYNREPRPPFSWCYVEVKE